MDYGWFGKLYGILVSRMEEEKGIENQTTGKTEPKLTQ